jgi:hypothetical protein
MPNWCQNKLIVKNNGNENEFRQFIDKGFGKEIRNEQEQIVWRITNYFPTPELLYSIEQTQNQVKKCKDKYGFDNPNEWNQFYWGTEYCEEKLSSLRTDDKTYLSIEFTTSWNLPDKLLVLISCEFPDLSFQIDFEEPGIIGESSFLIKNGISFLICYR